MELIDNLRLPFLYWLQHFQIHQKLSQDTLDWLNKPKTPVRCVFPLANLQSTESFILRACS